MTEQTLEKGRSATKQNIGSPIVIESFSQDNRDVNHPLIEEFVNAKSADEQLGIIKKIMKDQKDLHDQNIVKFLAVVYYEAPAKHPVKCLLTKHITKCSSIQPLFVDFLSTIILSELNYTDYKQCADVVAKVVACIENFPAGAAAVKCIDVKLAKFLVVKCNMARYRALRNQVGEVPYYPTASTEMHHTDHSIIRLLVHIVQKVELDNYDSSWAWGSITLYNYIQDMIQSEEVPMDTKCLCGVLILHFVKLETHSEQFPLMLLMQSHDYRLKRIMQSKAGQLAIYAAYATLIPMEELQKQHVFDIPVIIIILGKLLSILENTSEQALTLGVARALLQLSKSLSDVRDKRVGARVVRHLLHFVWRHLEYLLDSVRHLSQHILANVIEYCAQLEKEVDGVAGYGAPLEALIASLRSLGSCKSFYWGLGRLGAALGAGRVLRAVCAPLPLLRAALQPHLQAAAMGAIDTLLEQHSKEVDSLEIFETWVRPTLALAGAGVQEGEEGEGVDSASLAVLQAVLAAAVRHNEAVLPHIASYMRDGSDADGASGGRVRGALLAARAAHKCRAFLTHTHLRAAMLHPEHETRMLALSLVADSRKSTQVLSAAELTFVFNFLRYNINQQSHNFQQLMLANIKKILKRMSDSWRVVRGSGDSAHYCAFYARVLPLCYASCARGSGAARRAAALALLRALRRHAAHIHWDWKEEHVETLLLNLEDSYEANKAIALDLLRHCPDELLKKSYSTSLDLKDILEQASSLKPSESDSAAYKLQLLLDKLPERILEKTHKYTAEYKGDSALQAAYGLVHALCVQVTLERPTFGGVGESVRRGGMFGTLHCLAAVLRRPEIAGSLWRSEWLAVSRRVTETSLAVLADVQPVVSAASPEGYLPPDFAYNGDEEEKPITSQMLLVCAWRSVKEASCVLGSMGAALPDRHWQCLAGDICQCLVSLLSTAQHRGALELAAKGLATVAERFWQDPGLAYHCETWVRRTLEYITNGEGAPRHATRRGAGLPYILQALVITELKSTGRDHHFHECMRTLLRLAASSPQTALAPTVAPTVTPTVAPTVTPTVAPSVTPTVAPTVAPKTPTDTAESADRRALCANILRALFRSSGLEAAVAPYVEEGLCVALQGFGAAGWPERNAMCLLFSALCVRAFGVERARGADVPDRRNTRSGRVFAARYPRLCDVMLNIMKEACAAPDSGSGALQPCLVPVLLLLSRLYPSALEGTDTSFMLSTFVPRVVACAAHSVLAVRRVAAKAVRSILPPQQYIPHLEWMFRLLSDASMRRNCCHGVLLQVRGLLAAPPAGGEPPHVAGGLLAAPPAPAGQAGGNVPQGVRNTVWILEQCLGSKPCFVIADEYVNVVSLLLWRFPEAVDMDFIGSVRACLEDLLSKDRSVPVSTGRELCLANCLYLYLILLHKEKQLDRIVQNTLQLMQHKCYEVAIATLNYYLMLHDKFEQETKLESHLKSVCDVRVLETIRQTPKYFTNLAQNLHEYNYLECQRKSLRLLTLEKGTQRAILKVTEVQEEVVITKLLDCISYGRNKDAHMFLESLLSFAEEVFEKDFYGNKSMVIFVMRAVHNKSSADNSDETRNVVVSYLEANIDKIMTTYLCKLHDIDKVEYKALVLATLVTLLEDDEKEIRQRAANVAAALARPIILGDIKDGKLEDVTMKDGKLEDVTIKDGKLEDVTIKDGKLEDVTIKDGKLEDVTIKDGKLEDVTIKDGKLEDVTMKDGKLEYVTIKDGKLEDVTIEDISLREVALVDGELLPSICGEMLIRYVESLEDSAILFLVLALLDFNSEVCITDDIGDECRVFDQGERYNIYLDEAVWTSTCTDKFIEAHRQDDVDLIDDVLAIVNDRKYSDVFRTLCKENVVHFQKMAKDTTFKKDDTVNPKIELFIKKLRLKC